MKTWTKDHTAKSRLQLARTTATIAQRVRLGLDDTTKAVEAIRQHILPKCVDGVEDNKILDLGDSISTDDVIAFASARF